MENQNMSELSLEEIGKITGGELTDMNRKTLDLMIKLFQVQGSKMEEVYQIRGLDDETREYIRSRWYQILDK